MVRFGILIFVWSSKCGWGPRMPPIGDFRGTQDSPIPNSFLDRRQRKISFLANWRPFMQSDPIALTGLTRGTIGCQNLLCKSALA